MTVNTPYGSSTKYARHALTVALYMTHTLAILSATCICDVGIVSCHGHRPSLGLCHHTLCIDSNVQFTLLQPGDSTAGCVSAPTFTLRRYSAFLSTPHDETCMNMWISQQAFHVHLRVLREGTPLS